MTLARGVKASGMVDIHCHILPGIDDGPPDMVASAAMARAAAAAGITTVAATPHLRADFPKVRVDEIGGRAAELQAALDAEDITLTIVSAAEVSLSWALRADDQALRLASYGQHGTDILIEAGPTGNEMLPSLLYEVASRGYRVVLAHAERIAELGADPALVDRLIEQQVILQVNAESLLGSRNAKRGKFARKLVQRQLAAIVASDGHRAVGSRAVGQLAEVVPLVARIGAGRQGFVLEQAPAAVLAGAAIPTLGHQQRRHAFRVWR